MQNKPRGHSIESLSLSLRLKTRLNEKIKWEELQERQYLLLCAAELSEWAVIVDKDVVIKAESETIEVRTRGKTLEHIMSGMDVTCDPWGYVLYYPTRERIDRANRIGKMLKTLYLDSASDGRDGDLQMCYIGPSPIEDSMEGGQAAYRRESEVENRNKDRRSKG